MAKKASQQRRKRTAKHQQAQEARKKQQRNQILTIVAAAAVITVAALIIFFVLPGEEEEAQEDVSAVEDRPLADVSPAERNNYYSAFPSFRIDNRNEYEALLHTEKGDIRLRLFDDQSPLTVSNFVFLAREGYYDGTTFHRVIDNFMAQAGDPTGTGQGGPGYAFQDETSNGLVFDRPGLLAMANTGQPASNGSQFFITYVERNDLNGRHTIFGELLEGREVLDSLTRIKPDENPGMGDVIESVEIIERAES